jgi:hypothetical protein
MTMKKSIRCPDHKDKHASAVLYTRQDGSQWLHCKGCKANRLYKEGDKNMSIREKTYIEDESEIDYGVDVKQCLNPIELLEKLEEQKGITSEMITHFGGFSTDTGYLGFKYGNDREVYRRLTDDNRPRFINTVQNKGLLNDESIHMWDEIFLLGGLTDFISFIWYCKNNAVCSMGEELSDQQAYLLRGKTVFILFDRDFQGYVGAKQAEAKLKEYGATPIILELPDGFELSTHGKKVDVNYLIHKEKEAFKAWLEARIKKYKTFDDTYLETFKMRVPLKYFKTDIPKIKMTEGLYVVSGPPGVGKTTMGISLVDHFSKQGESVLYCNYDLPKDQIIARLASRYSLNHSWEEIEANPLLITSERNLEESLKQCLKNVKVSNNLTRSEIKYCGKYYSRIVIDYIQRVPNYETDKLRGLEMLMDMLSDMTSNEGKTVVGISRQTLGGNPYSGSASIPYHAQACLLLSPTDEGIISCNIDKNTRGETGNVLFKVDYAHQMLKPTKLNEIADEKFRNMFTGE